MGQRTDVLGLGRAGNRGRAWGVAACMLIAGVVRAVCDMQTAGVPSIRHLIGDAAGYWEWAREIAGGNWLGNEAYYQAPLYPYTLAVVFRVLGESVWGVRAVQALWGTLAVGLTCAAAWQLFGRRCGIVAGMMLALYAPAVYFDGIVQKTSLGCVLTCGVVACLSGMTFVCGLGRSGLLGVLAGALVLTRENALVWVPLLACWVAWREDDGDGDTGVSDECHAYSSSEDASKGSRARRSAIHVALFAMGVLVTLGPVAFRNWSVSGEWSFSTFQAGPNFYIGNHRGASGLYEPLIRGHETPAFERRDATALAERELRRDVGVREVSEYWLARGVKEIREDPWGWLRLLAWKAVFVWNRYEVSDVESQYVHAESSGVLKALGSVWHFGVLCPLAAVGLAGTWRDRRRLWIYYVLIASMAGSVALFYVLARYRFVLVPLLTIFAAAGGVEVFELLSRRAYRRLIRCVLLGGAVAVVANRPMVDEERLDALAVMNAGVAVAKDGDVSSATAQFRRAVRMYPESAEANNNLAMALALQGDYAGAIRHYQAALAVDPELSGVAYNLGVALERVGRLGEALVQYERAAALDASDPEARKAVARLRAGR